MQILPPPGPERRRQVVLLSFLLIMLAGLFWYWSAPAVPSSVTSNQAGGTARATPDQLPVPDALKLETLRTSSELDDAGRNPFVFGQRNEPSAPGSSFLTPPQPGPTGPAAPLLPPVPQGPPPIPLRLTGLTVVQTGGRALVTLKDPSSNGLYQAFEGDIVDGRYRVVKVGVQSVVVSYLDGSGIRTLALGG